MDASMRMRQVNQIKKRSQVARHKWGADADALTPHLLQCGTCMMQCVRNKNQIIGAM
jgi:hypothetical protein